MGFTRAELEASRDRAVPELMPEHPRLVFVGIDPDLWTAATGAPFAHPGNRFHPETVGEAQLWVVPNPGGPNARGTAATLAAAYTGPARAAGIVA